VTAPTGSRPLPHRGAGEAWTRRELYKGRPWNAGTKPTAEFVDGFLAGKLQADMERSWWRLRLVHLRYDWQGFARGWHGLEPWEQAGVLAALGVALGGLYVFTIGGPR